MYQLYKKTQSGFDKRKLMGEYKELEKIREIIDAETAKDPEFRYIIEETTGKVNIYGELIVDVVDEN
ncbi:MAG: hypothetical protein GX638_07530 [Crenarchaeota archaeon]|nr:hypothetical protein [Thermoproteota archaeon]